MSARLLLRYALRALLALAAVAAAGSAHAQEAATALERVEVTGTPGSAEAVLLQAPRVQPAAYALTVSGGVSLGAYEGGFLAYTAGAARAEGAARLRLLTGASAGSLNGLLGIIAACGEPVPGPAESLFWQTWIPVGYERLFDPEDVTPLGAFSRDWLEAQAGRIQAVWDRGLSSSCDVVLGVSATRVEPRLVSLAGGRLTLPRMEEKFALRIQGRGPGRPPRVTNYTAPDSPRSEPLLVTDAQGEVAFVQVRELVFASMSFPVAFTPQPLATCAAGATAHPGVCLRAEARVADYIDGGIFDNTPLRMSVGLARDGLVGAPGGGPAQWRDAPARGSGRSPAEVRFMFVDPDAAEYPEAPPRASGAAEPAALPQVLGGVAAAFIDTARSKELAMLLEEEPEVAERLSLPRRHFPAASAPLGAFFGFFETDLRRFDFYLGMYDARAMLLHEDAAQPGRFRLPEGEGEDWRPLACMRAVYDGPAGAEAACAGDALANFRVLLQVSMDRLYSVCRDAGSAQGPRGWRNAHCARAAAGGTPPRVPHLLPRRWPDWRQGRREVELSHVLRLLGAYGFHFRDLGASQGRDDVALLRIRQAIGRAVKRLSDVQPGDAGRGVAFAGKLFADGIAYAPPRLSLHVAMGPTLTEAGVSLGTASPELPRGLRLASSLGLRGLQRAFSSAGGEPFALSTVVGPEFRPPALQAQVLQGRSALRAGWQFGGRTARAGVDCERTGVGTCSRPVVQGLLGVTVLERLRVQVVGEWYPPVSGQRGLWSVAPGLGVELNR